MGPSVCLPVSVWLPVCRLSVCMCMSTCLSVGCLFVCAFFSLSILSFLPSVLPSIGPFFRAIFFPSVRLFVVSFFHPLVRPVFVLRYSFAHSLVCVFRSYVHSLLCHFAYMCGVHSVHFNVRAQVIFKSGALVHSFVNFSSVD